MAVARVPIKFDIYRGDQYLRSETFAEPIIKIGKVASSHLRLDDEVASRMHAMIEVTSPDEIYIIDLGSASGTYVNGQRSNKARLQSGDEITIGETRIYASVEMDAEGETLEATIPVNDEDVEAFQLVEAASAQSGFDSSAMDAHVVEALRVSQGVALALVEPADVIASILYVSRRTHSLGFRQLAQMLGNYTVPRDVRPTSTLSADLFAAPLRQSIVFAQGAGPQRTRTLQGRDLIAAVLLCGGRDLEERLERAGTHLQDLRDQWFTFVTEDMRSGRHTGRSEEEWRAWWRHAGVPLPEQARPGYATESDEGDDKLGIEQEAHAFARLMLDRDVKAPLSIGLLGDWGSGKSFFIEQIKRQVALLKGSARPELYTKVIELEFNAWHASDSNLWASLVTYIFDEIWANVSNKNANLAQTRKELLEKMSIARGAVHEAEAQVEQARATLHTAEKELERKRDKLALKHYVQMQAERLREVARAAGFRQQLETIDDVEKAANMLHSSSDRLRLLVKALLEHPVAYVALPVALIAATTTGFVLFVPELISSYLVQLGDSARTVMRWGATIFGSLCALAEPLKLAAGKLDRLSDQVESVKNEFDLAVDKARRDNPQQARAVVSARSELASAEASVEVARRQLAELLSQHAALDPSRRMGAFLQDRAQSAQYRSQQGIISLVHKDFRTLSEHIKLTREENPKATPFERIVLYVDDLDRCRPDQVVHMLEAVHLLLALDLFVVVVAVDSRWLMRSLEVHYKDLLSSDNDDHARRSTPQSYLEKIFQITYALAPMQPNHFAQYVASLAGSTPRDAANGHDTASVRRASNSPSSGEAVGEPGSMPDPAATLGDTPPAERADGRLGAASATPSAVYRRDAVRLDRAEQQLIVQLVALLPTPRIAKRLVNVYRLIKSLQSVQAIRTFKEQKRERSCLLMLAILFGRPLLAAKLFRELHERASPFHDPQRSFTDALAERARINGANMDWQELHQLVASTKLGLTVRECTREPCELARYSLVSGHDWHTWATRGEASA